ncbi:uncharacterized protein EDB91DRAFT_1080608 [Suillus paluster]|uniref:uncharacterized protein n=1 Tax=Suillus paluster TaxID=48578 RepID=UPI001B85ED2E|nr:uncharacterized protein EDB91DRAFT_1080608 [Suillus paluster]KAG1745115.1 hypothetical protein EDB91DRAFT_1080608 [Suillus paluster]
MSGLAAHLVREYFSASNLLEAVWKTLYSHTAAANIILPHAEKVLKAEKQSQTVGSQLWLVCFSPRIGSILSCTEGPLGAYPIFIFTPIPFNELVGKDLDTSLSILCHALLPVVGRQRVFSFFLLCDRSQKPSSDTRGSCIAKGFLQAQHVTLHESSRTSQNTAVDLRRASLKDIDRVAILCRDFSATSYPFILSPSRAWQEAIMLTKERNIWVLEITVEEGEPDIASIVAVTRKSKLIVAITKGFGLMLVRHVCEELLVNNERVVLYVGKDNGAMNVYHRIGFYGLGTDQTPPPDGIEPWLEVGFDPVHASLGHW